MVICDRLRTLREERKLSQGDIEKRTGLLRCYISRVENGHTVPTVETQRRRRGRSKCRCTGFSTTVRPLRSSKICRGGKRRIRLLGEVPAWTSGSSRICEGFGGAPRSAIENCSCLWVKSWQRSATDKGGTNEFPSLGYSERRKSRMSCFSDGDKTLNRRMPVSASERGTSWPQVNRELGCPRNCLCRVARCILARISGRVVDPKGCWAMSYIQPWLRCHVGYQWMVAFCPSSPPYERKRDVA